ncbi:MAG: glycosyltransferase family 4 protein [Leptonema sp. (in: Bacteria)]|nr:glycosyltransferase family 4 protein [Leptonema sp. (in: bacteria)]
MKKILFIADFFGPEPGGMENFNTGLVHGQKNVVVLVTASSQLGDQSKYKPFDEQFGTPVYRIAIPIPNFLVPTPKKNRDFVDSFQRLIDQEKPEHILFANLYGRNAGLVPIVYRLGIPFSVILQPFDLDQLSMLHLNLHRFLKRANSIFVFSNYFYDLALLKGLPERTMVSVPFGLHVRWNRRQSQNAQSKLLKKLKGTDVKFRILSMGPLTRDKNLDRVFQVIEQLDKMGIDRSSYSWIIGGSGPEYGYLKEMIHLHHLEDTVILTGFLDDIEVGALYYYCDLYFHPGGQQRNQASGYSASILEAGYTSLPVISGSGAGVDEIIRNLVTGVMHSAEDYTGLAKSIVELSRDAELREKMGRFAEDRVLTEYNIERTRHQIFQRL